MFAYIETNQELVGLIHRDEEEEETAVGIV